MRIRRSSPILVQSGEILLGTLVVPAVGEEEKSRLGTILTASGRNCLPTSELGTEML